VVGAEAVADRCRARDRRNGDRLRPGRRVELDLLGDLSALGVGAGVEQTLGVAPDELAPDADELEAGDVVGGDDRRVGERDERVVALADRVVDARGGGVLGAVDRVLVGLARAPVGCPHSQ
jgi:hypothetical protein